MSSVARRSLTVPIVFILSACLPLFLIGLPLAGVIDLARRSNWATVRALTFLAVYVTCEAVGIIAATVAWLAYTLVPGFTHATYLRCNFQLQCSWASALFRGIEAIFGIRTEVEGNDCIEPGPIVVYSRHASTGDTLLPAVFISSRHDIVLRYVLKKELLWDPCLDIVGNRLRNYFVDRQSTAPAREVEEVAKLAIDLGPKEGVLIFPEGTRFSERKRDRAIDQLARDNDTQLAEVARSMRNVLPPKLGGPTALLQQNPDVDLILVAHTGFENVESLATLFNGSLIGRKIHLRFWRVARSDIPNDPKAIAYWLFDAWRNLDQWIEENREVPVQQPA